MERKFQVSRDAARLLKEKGYNDYCHYYYTDEDEHIDYLEDAIMYDEYVEWTLELYLAPTKAEAIDWLESKGMRINIIYDWIECKWYFTIISPTAKKITELEVSDSVFYKTRLEAEDAAIIKALELLK